jgi:hypothetical protein
MLKFWIASLIVVTLLCGLTYVITQHILRADANDPQIQMAEDAATALAKGQPPQSVLPRTKVAMDKSLAPFVIIYDSAGQPVATSGTINNQAPLLPNGVLEATKQNGEDRITWQPQNDTRIAAVITAYSGTTEGFVLAGRSLREVESRESEVLIYTIIAWIASLITISVPFALPFIWKKEKKTKRKRK